MYNHWLLEKTFSWKQQMNNKLWNVGKWSEDSLNILIRVISQAGLLWWLLVLHCGLDEVTAPPSFPREGVALGVVQVQLIYGIHWGHHVTHLKVKVENSFKNISNSSYYLYSIKNSISCIAKFQNYHIITI